MYAGKINTGTRLNFRREQRNDDRTTFIGEPWSIDRVQHSVVQPRCREPVDATESVNPTRGYCGLGDKDAFFTLLELYREVEVWRNKTKRKGGKEEEERRKRPEVHDAYSRHCDIDFPGPLCKCRSGN